MYMHTSIRWFRAKTLHSVFEQKKYIVLKSYALASNASNHTHTHIKSYHFVLHTHTHTHLTCSLKHNINQNVYRYITPSSYKKSSFHYKNIINLDFRKSMFTTRILSQERQGSQPSYRAGTSTFDRPSAGNLFHNFKFISLRISCHFIPRKGNF
jgi:hypothetical protein